MLRAESQTSQFVGRRRSNTAQSLLKSVSIPAPLLKVGDSKALTTWVHDPKESPTVTLNHSWWPGVAEGDMLRLSSNNMQSSSGFLFIVPRDEGSLKHQLQISVPRPVAETFGFRNNGEALLTKVDKEKWSADYVELTFQDQYLGRNDMWRLGNDLVGQCVYMEQEISFIGVITAKVQGIYINGNKVSAAYVTSSTKTIYRSLSAKLTIFIQVCRELWEFAGDGERYNEKIVHSFLPALFSKWREAGTNHIVTIVLISRVYYDLSEIDYAAGPLRVDDEGRWYKDFFRVITDLEVLHDWKPTLRSLKDSFWAFQRDVLLSHHCHRSALYPTSLEAEGSSDHVRLVGQLSFAHDGPLLEALNLGLNPMETHYIDRSLSLTGSLTIIVTPGTGYFRVSKQLLRLTTTRLLDQGFAVELVSLAKPPLHLSPIFSFEGSEPEIRADASGKISSRALDPLWGGNDDDDANANGQEKKTFWWEPFWMSVSFWDRQMDLPFRQDRFVARAKMHEIEMLGLLDHDVLSGIQIPYLPFDDDDVRYAPLITQEDADKFDMEVFAAKPDPTTVSRNSIASSGSAPTELKRSSSNRISDVSKISPIEESPRRGISGPPAEGDTLDLEQRLSVAISTSGLSTSPSQSSILSNRSARSHRSTISASQSTPRPPGLSTSRSSIKSRLTQSWLFSPFRGGLSQPETSPISASAVTGTTTPTTTIVPSALQSVASTPVAHSFMPRSPKPMVIKNIQSGHSLREQSIDEQVVTSHRGPLPRTSPINTPPRDEPTFGKRRSATIGNSVTHSTLFSSPAVLTDPSRPHLSVPYTQSALARRWQHMFPQPLSKHDIKWKSMVTPACLPLTVEHFPVTSELETSYDVFSYDFVVDPPEMHSFLVKLPTVVGTTDEVRRSWALAVMRGMVALRLAQGFQFVLRPSKKIGDDADDGLNPIRRSKSYVAEEDMNPRPTGAADVLKFLNDAVYLGMSNEIHRISYGGDSIQVRRYVRRIPRAPPFDYKCLIWPKFGERYTELTTSFVSHSLENYGWNRLDMLIAGYETQFNESLRYWRTRFVVIPMDEPSNINVGPPGEKLNEEEIRLLGMDKLAEMFSKVRWQPPEDRGKPSPPVRFIPTDLGPAQCVLDENVIAQLDEIHAAGPLRKKSKNDREIGDMSLASVAKAMREEDGVPIKDHKWHGRKYANSFTGADLVSWLVREFGDVSSRDQGVECGVRLMEQGLFDHCRGSHGFLDGHYFYVLKGEYIIPMTPRGGWFRSSRHTTIDEAPRASLSTKKPKKRLLLSQSMVIDIDPNKRSDQAESVILHHDIIQNPATCFHFEFQWIGTTARCIDDLLRQWSRTIERYGLKLVEAYVTQISDIREHNPFQSCFPLPLAVPPPVISNLEQRVPEGLQTENYFEYALLRRSGFVLDIEAANNYSDQVDVVYSYRRSPYKYSQWVHRSGVAFIQVLDDSRGFLFLTNPLMAPGRIGTALKYQRPAAVAEEIRIKLHQFCSDAQALTRFYDDELAQLPHVPDEPPPLRI